MFRCQENTGRHLKDGKLTEATRERDMIEHGDFLAEYWAHDPAQLDSLLAQRCRQTTMTIAGRTSPSASRPAVGGQTADRLKGNPNKQVVEWVKTLPYCTRQNLSLALSWAVALNRQQRSEMVDSQTLPSIPSYVLSQFLAELLSTSAQLDGVVGLDDPLTRYEQDPLAFGINQGTPTNTLRAALQRREVVKNLIRIQSRYLLEQQL